MCHGGCGVLLHIEDGRLIKVEGDPESPFNRGSLCVKGLSTLELVYHPDRVLFPLKRTGARGSGKWGRVSWDEALSEICGKLRQLIEEAGPESIGIAQGTGRHHYVETLRFANALGTPNVIEPGAAQCYLPRVTISQLTYGDFPVGDYNDETPPKCVLFWGANPVVSGPDGKVCFSIARAIPRIKHSIAIDPRRSETARKCGLHLQIRPGSDTALALAMINVIITERLYNPEFIEKWTVGFDEIKGAVSDRTPEWASGITWIAPDLIRLAARTYAREKPNILEWGVAIEQTPSCLQAVRSLAVLRGLAGTFDVPGGELLGMHILKTPPVNAGKNAELLVSKRLGAGMYKLLGGRHAFIRMAHAPTMFRAMLTGKPYPVNSLLVFGSNLLTSYANPRLIGSALDRLKLIVVADFFKTPTAERADFILPAAAWPEINALVGLPYMAENAVLVQQRGITVGECRPDEEIFLEMADRLGLDYQRADTDEALNRRLRRTGISFEDLKASGFHRPAHDYGKYEAKGFRTPSRKIELSSSILKELGYDPVPRYEEPPETPLSEPGLLPDFPYILITGARTNAYFLSEGRQIESRRRTRRDPLALIHPEAARENGIEDNEWIEVKTPRGAASFKARVTQDIHPRVVSIDHAWWSPENPPPDHGVWESNANLLTRGDGPYDPAFGSCQLRALLCRITRRPFS